MGFLDLPSEIIDLVIDLSLPSGIEGLALTCKALYGRAKTQIGRHNTLKREWRCADFHQSEVRGDVASILHRLSLDPLGAKYIEVLNLCDKQVPLSHQSEHGPEVQGDEYNFRTDPEAIVNIIKLVSRSTSGLGTQLVDVQSLWEEPLVEAGDGALSTTLHEQWQATIVLIALVPNLRTLRLPTAWKSISTDARRDERAKESLSSLATMVSAAKTLSLIHN